VYEDVEDITKQSRAVFSTCAFSLTLSPTAECFPKSDFQPHDPFLSKGNKHMKLADKMDVFIKSMFCHCPNQLNFKYDKLVRKTVSYLKFQDLPSTISFPLHLLPNLPSGRA